jgi:hypothetical protein
LVMLLLGEPRVPTTGWRCSPDGGSVMSSINFGVSCFQSIDRQRMADLCYVLCGIY